MAQLDPTAEDKRQAREALLGLLATADVRSRPRGALPRRPNAEAAMQLAAAVFRLDPAEDERRQVREALLALLLDDLARGEMASQLADTAARLTTTAEDRRQAREALLALLADPASASVATH